METHFSFSDEPKGALHVHFAYEGDKIPISGIPASFTGKKLDSLFMPERRLLFVGLGKRESIDMDYYRRAAAKAARTASSYKIPSVYFASQGLSAGHCVAAFEGAFLANYYFDKYKAAADRQFRVQKILFPSYAKRFEPAMHSAHIVCRNVLLVRDLVSDNSDAVTPEKLEDVSRKIARAGRMYLKVVRGAQLKRLGLNLIYNVGKAGSSEPRILILEYRGDTHSKERVMFAGKGVCFDSGGLDIKPANSMLGMHMDMAGAAIVIGIMKSAAELKLKKNIVGLLGCVENLVDSRSYRPGDVIPSYMGLSVENLNTDAEGRLVLADVLSYGVKKYDPSAIIEYSTLTGSIVKTLGSHCAGVVTTSKELGEKISAAGLATYERVWVMPLFEEYLDEVTGEKADLRSINKSGNNGAIFGGAFLSKFVEGRPFVHIDVAGTAILDDAKDYMPKGGSGFGVRLAMELLKKL